MKVLRDASDTSSADEDNPYWVSFSDIMAGILVVFILATLSLMIELIQKREQIDDSIKELVEAEQVRKDIILSVRDRLAEQNILVEVSENDSVIRIPESELNFRTLSYEIPDSNRDSVRIIGTILFEEISREHKKSGKERWLYLDTVFVEGHTDNRPTSESKVAFGNWGLSALRALSLWKYWELDLGSDMALAELKNHHLEPLFSVSGYGEGRPITSQQTNEEEWRTNRRIDLRFTVKQPKLEDLKKIREQAS